MANLAGEAESGVVRIAFNRLHRLVEHGYRAKLGITKERDVIQLWHPKKECPDITLFFDGCISGINIFPDNDDDPDWIGVDSFKDDPHFERFLAKVPCPSMLQSLEALSIWEVKIMVVLSILVLGVYFLFYHLFSLFLNIAKSWW